MKPIARITLQREGIVRTALRAAVVIALCSQAACTQKAAPVTSPSESVSSRGAAPSGPISLNCSDPIDTVPSPARPYSAILDVVGLNFTSTLQVNTADGTAPHRLFAKTGLFVHAGRKSSLTVPEGWENRVSIGWGNHAPERTTSLHIPACSPPPAASGEWLVFPGGFVVDRAACVPLRVRTGNETTTVRISVGVRCPD